MLENYLLVRVDSSAQPVKSVIFLKNIYINRFSLILKSYLE